MSKEKKPQQTKHSPFWNLQEPRQGECEACGAKGAYLPDFNMLIVKHGGEPVVHLANGPTCVLHQLDIANAELAKLREALTPSADTKAEYIGEFEFGVEVVLDDESLATDTHAVPWTTIKEIMAAIRKRAERQAT